MTSAPAVSRLAPWRLLAAHLGALLWGVAIAWLVFYLLIYVSHATALIRYPYDVDQGEGYDLNSGWLLANGQPIYTDNRQYPYYSSNYPPVFSGLLAPIVAQTGPVIGAGRALSTAAALLTVLLIAATVRQRTRHGLAALTAGLLYVASTYVYHVTPLSRVNALATMFALAGLYCCLQPGRRWLVGAVAAFLLALFTKQTTIDAVVAGLVYLLLCRRWDGITATLGIGVLGAGAWAALDLVSGGQFFVNVFVGNVNPFLPGQLIDYYRDFLEIHLVIVAMAAWATWRATRHRTIAPFELYWGISLVLALSVGKWGAGESYFLAPIVASCVLSGDCLASAARRPAALGAVGSVLIVQLVLFGHGPLSRLSPVLDDRGLQASVLGREPGQEDLRVAAELVDQLRQHPGPVLVEDPGFALAAGKEVVGNATHLRNLHAAGVWSGDRLIADLAERRFAFVVLDAELYPEPVLAAIGRYYYLFEEYPINGTRQQLFAPGAD